MASVGKIAGGAGAGAAAGAPLGPWGMAGGALVGGVLSALGGDGNNTAPAPAPVQYGGNPLTSQLAAQAYYAGLQQQQAQNAREAAFYGNANGNFDVGNAAQGRQSAQIIASPADQQRQLAALGATNAGIGNLNSTGNLLTGIGTRAMGPSVAEAQLRLGQSDAMNQQLALARSGRSLGSGQAAMNQAAFNNAQINQTTNQQAAAARLQEQQNYQNMQLAALQGAGNAFGSAGGLAGQAGNQATTIRSGNENLQQQNAALGQQQQQINNQTTGLYNQLGAQQQQLGMQANAQGQNAYQFGAQQASGMMGDQLNADTGRLSSSTATNIANQNNANAHDAAYMNMASSGLQSAADAFKNSGSDTPTNANNPSGSTSPFKNITTASNSASDERLKTNIKALEPASSSMVREPAINNPKYSRFSAKDAEAYRSADEKAAADAKAGVTPTGFSMDDPTQGLKPVANENPAPASPGPSPVGYADAIAALNNAYRPSQFAPADVLNHVPGAGAGHSASQDAVIAALSAPPGKTHFAPLAAAPGGINASFATRAPQLGASTPTGAQLSALGHMGMAPLQDTPQQGGGSLPRQKVALTGATLSPPAPTTAAPAWGDVFNQPQLDPRVADYLNGLPQQTGTDWSKVASGVNSGDANFGPMLNPLVQGLVNKLSTQQQQDLAQQQQQWAQQPHQGVSSDVHSKTRIRDLEAQIAALGGEAPQRSGETTRLPAGEERRFAQWLRQNNVRDLDHPDSHYDYRGAYLGGVGRGADSGHFPDTYKQHGHPTFSIESQYSQNANDGGTWEGERFSPAVRPRAPDYAALDAAYAREQQAPAIDLRPARGYSYEYKDPSMPGTAPGRHVGPMAQDLEHTAAAGAVYETPYGKQVDGGRLALVNTAAISEQQRKTQELERQLAALRGSGLGPMPAYDRSLYAQPGAF